MRFWIFLTLLAVSLQALASFEDANVLDMPLGLSRHEGAEYLREHLAEGQYVLASSTFVLNAVSGTEKSQDPYPSGDFYFMWSFKGDHVEKFTHGEYIQFWKLMNDLSQKGFRVIFNVRTLNADLASAVQSQGTSVIIYSAHGNDEWMSNMSGTKIDYKLFRKKAKSLYQFIASTCRSGLAKKNYAPPKDLLFKGWDDRTDSADLFDYLLGGWSPFDGKDLGVRK